MLAKAVYLISGMWLKLPLSFRQRLGRLKIIPKIRLALYKLMPYELELKQLSAPLEGYKMMLKMPEYTSYENGTYETICTNAIRSLIKPGWVALDIGAHIGYMTLLLSKCVNSRGSVIVFEPMPDNVRVLEENVKLNGIRNVTIEAKAVINQNGTATIFRSEWPMLVATSSLLRTADRPVFQEYLVETISIDKYCQERNLSINFVKIDVEGVEDLVIEGMTETLEKDQPLILIEIHGEADGSEHRALRLLIDHDYTLKGLYPSGEMKDIDTTYRGHVLARKQWISQ